MSEDRNGSLADGNDSVAGGGDLTSPLLSHAIEAVEEEPAVSVPIALLPAYMLWRLTRCFGLLWMR